jgi:Ca2+-binding RTX toxin-like protein
MTFQGQEYLINSTTTGNQSLSTQTVLGNGDILVTWESQEGTDYPNEIRARILNPDGNVSSPDFVVNAAAESQNAVSTTTLPNGDALVTWSSTNLTTGENDVFARVVDAQGHLGPEVVVSSSVINSEESQSGVSAATLADGDVMLVSSTVTTNAEGGRDIVGHLLGADGHPIGSGFTIDPTFADDQFDPAVTAMPDGRAFVTWVVQNHGSGTMYGQILNADGSADGSYFQISPPAGGFNADPTALSNDNVLVTWDANDGIHGQIVDSNGAASGSNFVISDGGALESVTALTDGRAVAVWEQAGSSGDGIYARVINADGSMSDPEFIVNSATDRSGINPHVTELPNGEIFVTWTSTGANADEDIHGRLLTLDHTISGTVGNDALHGGAGADEIYGAAGNDSITGGAGDDVLSGGTGHNVLWGNDGNDTFLGGAGTDSFSGGAGSNTVTYELSYAGVSVDLATNTASGGDAAGDTFSFIQNVTGSAYNDALTGDANANHLDGGAGNDLIWGGEGNDTLVGGHGADVLSGGTGIDTADYSKSPSAVTVDLALGTGSGGDAQGDKLSSIENVTGSAFNDHLTGSNAANQLSGSAGNDILIGGAGADTLTGGDGADTFVFKTADSTPGHADQITDFSHAQGDHIDLSGIDANTQASGDQHFTYIGGSTFTDVAGQLHYANHLLEGDTNGDGKADIQIHVNVASLSAGDLIL